MTTPTQAQTEAIREILRSFHRNSCYPEAMGVEINLCADQIVAALTAAAEVGIEVRSDPNEAIVSYTMTQWRQKMKAHEAATIERCAQWLVDDGNHATAREMRKALLPAFKDPANPESSNEPPAGSRR